MLPSSRRSGLTSLARASARVAPWLAAVCAAWVLTRSSPARADIGLGLFVGEPFGLDLKIDLERRSALDLLFGATTVRDGRADYGHVTYLVTPLVGRGRSVLVPLRLGLGAAVFDGGGDLFDEVNVAVRAPLQLGFVLRSAPLEIYAELAFKLVLLDENDNQKTADFDGGIGFRLLL